MWKIDILLKSGNLVSVDKLTSINTMSQMDSSIKKLTDFNSFHLTGGQQLSFVGENTIVSLKSSEIEYVKISKRS